MPAFAVIELATMAVLILIIIVVAGGPFKPSAAGTSPAFAAPLKGATCPTHWALQSNNMCWVDCCDGPGAYPDGESDRACQTVYGPKAPSGSTVFHDLGLGACYACPKSHPQRTVFAANGSTACQAKGVVIGGYSGATWLGSDKIKPTMCPKGYPSTGCTSDAVCTKKCPHSFCHQGCCYGLDSEGGLVPQTPLTK